MRPHSNLRKRNAFTLIEVLTVLAVIAIIMAIATPSINTMMQGSKINQGRDQILNVLSMAQQSSIKDNDAMEVRFFKYVDPNIPEPKPKFRAFQVVKKVVDPTSRNQSGFKTLPVTKLNKLPPGIVIVDEREVSPLVTSQDLITQRGYKLNGIDDQAEYFAFHFRPDGSTSLPKGGGELWFLSLINEQDQFQAGSSGLPPNFVTIQIDAHNGHIRAFQPGFSN